jgi:hypothetical protein
MPRSFRSQQRHATIATAGNEMQLGQSIAAAQVLLHARNPNPSNPEGFGTPHGSRELSSELVVWYYPPGRHVNAKNNKKGCATRLMLGPYVTRLLWVCAVLILIVAEGQIIVSYLHAPAPHPPFGIGRLLMTVLVVSVPGLAGLRGYAVVKRLPSAITGDDQTKLIWLAREFLVISIFAYVAMGWVTR